MLNAFRLEQTGDQIRVIDSDGSIYAGSLETTPVPAQSTEALLVAGNRKAQEADQESKHLAEGAALAVQPGAAPAVVTPPAGQNYFFRVSGTNRTLQQLVVFSGQLENAAAASNASPAPVPTAAFGGAAKKIAGTVQLPVSNLRVSGHAVIGNSNQLDIIAEPSKP